MSKKIELAKQILKTMNVRCDKGGCQNHSGHEFCSVDEAWDEALERAETQLEKEQDSCDTKTHS